MIKRAVLLTTLLFLLFTLPAAAGVPEMADVLMNAYENNQPIPALTQLEPGMDMKTAYQVQQAYVGRRLVGDTIAGFKAGLTNVAVQKRFGMNEAAIGVLYGKGRYTGSPVIEFAPPKKFVIETEIGFVIGAPISRPLKDEAELKTKLSGVMPAIELPNMGFADMKLVKGVDIVACDVSADSFIFGKEIPVGDLDLNGLTVTLNRDGKTLYQGKGADAMGDQWATALWFVNAVLDQGYEIKPGHVLITGALGQVPPAAPGHYEADWGPLGTISFDVK